MKTRKSTWAILTVALALVPATALTACGGGSESKSAKITPGDMPEGGSWTGVFFSPEFGELHLMHQGSNVEGKWKSKDGSKWGELNGPAVGNVLHFEWIEHKQGLVGPSATSKGRGYFVYKRPTGENVLDELSGEWGLESSETGGGPWTCVKQQNRQPDLKSIGGDTEPTGPGGWKDE